VTRGALRLLGGLLAAGLLPVAPAASAQEAADRTVRGQLAVADAAAADLDMGTAARLSGAGILGGAVGFFGGAYLGAWIADSRDDGLDDLDALHGALIGATLGESTLLPLGVHLANGRRGNVWLSALASVGLAAGGVGLMEAAHWDAPAAPVIAVAVPLAQLAAAIAIERATD
jgi:hypothetical protein